MPNLIKASLISYLFVITIFNIRSLVILETDLSQSYQLGGDSGRYTLGAINLITGKELDYSQKSYIGYLAVVAIALSLNLGNAGVVLIQILINLTTGILLFVYLDRVTKNRTAALIASLLFLSSFELMKWATYILPDSVYISTLLMFVLVVLQPKADTKKIYVSLILAVICSLLRPNGFIVLLGWIVYVFLPNLKRKITWIPGILALVFGIWLVVSLTSSAQSRRIYEFSQNGEIIWSYKEYTLTVPPPSAPIKTSGDLITYYFSHPLVFSQLFAAKVITETIRIRPFLPANYNLFLIIYLIPLYFFAGYAWLKTPFLKKNNILLFLVVAHLSFVGLTYSDWDGRFLAHILPLIFIYSALDMAQKLQPPRPVDELN